jgi:hypothetical protein
MPLMRRASVCGVVGGLSLLAASVVHGEDLTGESFVVRNPSLAGGQILDARAGEGPRAVDATLGLPGVVGTAVGSESGLRLEAGFWPTAVQLRVDVVEDVVAAALDEIFAAVGHRDALLDRLAEVEIKLETGDPNGARHLLRNLLRRLDGCDGSQAETPDRNDWVVDCEEQRALRRLMERLLLEVVG